MTPEATAAREAVRRVWQSAHAIQYFSGNGPPWEIAALGLMAALGEGPTEADAWLAAAAGLEGREG